MGLAAFNRARRLAEAKAKPEVKEKPKKEKAKSEKPEDSKK